MIQFCQFIVDYLVILTSVGDGHRFIGDYILRTDLLSQWIPVVYVAFRKLYAICPVFYC